MMSTADERPSGWENVRYECKECGLAHHPDDRPEHDAVIKTVCPSCGSGRARIIHDLSGPVPPQSLADIDDVNRLFTPLESRHYRNFESGGKTWELRGINHQFNETTVVPGRIVELRRGYSTNDSLWGVITDVETFDSLNAVPDTIPVEQIHPGANRDEFLRSARQIIGEYDEFIAFHVDILEPA